MSSNQTSNPIPGLLRLVVVVGAGAAGWFGYDAYVEAEADKVEAAEVVAEATTEVDVPANDVAPPWPADLVVAEATWQGNIRVSYTMNGTLIQHLDSDGEGRSQLTFFEEGAPVLVAEIDGNSAWFDRQEGAGFETLSAEGTEQSRNFGATEANEIASGAPHPTMSDLVAPAAWPYTVVNADTASEVGTRILDITIDGGAFASAEPAAATQWRADTPWSRELGPARFLIEVNAAGEVESFTTVDESFVETRWEQLAEAPVFTSPIAG